MTIPRFIESSIHIDAPASRVWKVLTDAEYTRRYMFGCEIVSDLIDERAVVVFHDDVAVFSRELCQLRSINRGSPKRMIG